MEGDSTIRGSEDLTDASSDFNRFGEELDGHLGSLEQRLTGLVEKFIELLAQASSILGDSPRTPTNASRNVAQLTALVNGLKGAVSRELAGVSLEPLDQFLAVVSKAGSAERVAMGKEARRLVPRSSHAELTVDDTRPDPVWVAEDTLTGSRFRTPESGVRSRPRAASRMHSPL